MKLYYLPGACSLAAHIALHETGLPFEIDRLLKATMTTASGENFMLINPKGYVPTLRLDNGEILTEVAAVLQYIADQKFSAGLVPRAGVMERYRLQEWLHFIGTELHKSFSPLFNKAAPIEMKHIAREQLIKRMGYVETQLAHRDYLLDGQFTVADAYMFVVLGWSKHVALELAAFPKIREYLVRIAARPAVKAAMKAEGLIQ
jgi:glutathione S-transferase